MSKDIKKALEHCIEWDCVDCPNREELGSGETVCRGRLLTDVLEYVADLEVKLAERTKQLKIALKDFNDIQQKNDKLAQQIAEKEKEETKRMEDFEKGCQEYYKSNQTEIAELKNQLSEKDELLKQKIGDMKSTDFIRMCKECGFMVQTKEIDNQTAIRELEKVKKFLLEKIEEKQSCFDSGNYNDFADGVKTICELMLISIDNQIKSLKGE